MITTTAASAVRSDALTTEGRGTHDATHTEPHWHARTRAPHDSRPQDARRYVSLPCSGRQSLDRIHWPALAWSLRLLRRTVAQRALSRPHHVGPHLGRLPQ